MSNYTTLDDLRQDVSELATLAKIAEDELDNAITFAEDADRAESTGEIEDAYIEVAGAIERAGYRLLQAADIQDLKDGGDALRKKFETMAEQAGEETS